jgi:hypothetical protein
MSGSILVVLIAALALMLVAANATRMRGSGRPVSPAARRTARRVAIVLALLAVALGAAVASGVFRS